MNRDEESRILAAVESEIRREFPHVPAVSVRETMHVAHQAFDRASVRDFVPLLVGREVRSRLRHRSIDAQTLLLGH